MLRKFVFTILQVIYLNLKLNVLYDIFSCNNVNYFVNIFVLHVPVQWIGEEGRWDTQSGELLCNTLIF